MSNKQLRKELEQVIEKNITDTLSIRNAEVAKKIKKSTQEIAKKISKKFYKTIKEISGASSPSNKNSTHSVRKKAQKKVPSKPLIKELPEVTKASSSKKRAK